MATKTHAQIKSALLSAYNAAKANDNGEEAFAGAIATVLDDMQLAIQTQLDALAAKDSLGGDVILTSGTGSVTP